MQGIKESFARGLIIEMDRPHRLSSLIGLQQRRLGLARMVLRNKKKVSNF